MGLTRFQKLHKRIPEPAHAFLVAHPLPKWMEPVLARAYPFWAGRSYRDTARVLEDSQHWTSQQLAEFQTMLLREMLTHAYEHMQYYKAVMDDAGFDPRRIKSVADATCLPLISKETLRASQQAMTDRTVDPAGLAERVTSGTTSSSLVLRESQGAWGYEKAFFERWYGWLGCRTGDRAVLMSASPGAPVVTYNPIANLAHVNLANRDMVDPESQLRAVRAFDPLMIRGYPSALLQLALATLEEGRGACMPRLKRVFLASEQVFPAHVDLISEAFQVPVTSHYGLNERVALLQQCPSGTRYHVIPEYSVVEVIREDGKPATRDGEMGMIVGTGFANRAVPLIRYATEDWVVLAAEGECPDCGRQFRSVRRVEGRSGDFIRTPSGRRWGPSTVDWTFVDLPGVREAQFWQRSINEVVVLVVGQSPNAESDGRTLVERLENLIGEPGLVVSRQMVDSIERPPSQKQRIVRSDLPSAPPIRGL